MKDLLWSLPAFIILERQEPLSDGLHESLASFLILVNLPLRLIDHQSLDLSQSRTRSFVVSTGSFLSVRNLSHLEHLHTAVSKLEHNDTLDLGEVKLW